MFLIKEEAVNPEVSYKLVVVNNFAKFIRKALNLKVAAYDSAFNTSGGCF